MGNFVYNKKLFMDQIDKLLKDDDFIMISNTPVGTMSACSKKKNYKTFSMAFGEDLFKSPGDIRDLIQSRLFSLVVCKKDVLSDRLKEDIKKYEEELKQENKEDGKISKKG